MNEDATNEELAAKLLVRNRVGALLRIFTPSADLLEQRIESGLRAAEKLHKLEIGGKKVFSRIDFLVSNDQRYEDSDVAEITQALRDAIAEKFPEKHPMHVLDIKRGDIYSMLLNYGIVNQLEDRVPYSCIINHMAHMYIDQENIAALLAAMQNKARVAGLAAHKLEDLVMKGRIVNTFSMWHNKSLMTVGGFDVRSSKPLKDAEHPTVTYTSKQDHTTHTYHLAGCEEIISLIRMIRNFGKCIKPIAPHTRGLLWGPDAEQDPEGYKRVQQIIATKSLRQEHFAQLAGVSADFIEKGVL